MNAKRPKKSAPRKGTSRIRKAKTALGARAKVVRAAKRARKPTGRLYEEKLKRHVVRAATATEIRDALGVRWADDRAARVLLQKLALVE